MDKNFTVRTKILKPSSEVFAAIVSSDSIVKYFTDKASGDLKEDDQVIWTWEEYGDYPVTVKTIKTNSLIVLEWDSQDLHKTGGHSYPITVTMEFETLDDGNTMLSISESGWHTDEEIGLKGSFDNCGGWQHMAMCLKAYLEYGIDLR